MICQDKELKIRFCTATKSSLDELLHQRNKSLKSLRQLPLSTT